MPQTVNDWRLSTEEARQTEAAVRHHRRLMDAAKRPWSSVQPILVDRDCSQIISVARAVAITEQQDLSGLEKASQAMAWPAQRLDPSPLLTGDDLREHGIPPGPQYRVILETIRDQQLDGEISSTAQAWEIVKQLADSNRT